MKFIKPNAAYIGAALCSLVVGLSAVAVLGQTENIKGKDHSSRSFCSNNNYNWNDDHVSFRDLREMTATSNGNINVDGKRNGGVAVIGEDRSDILIRACIQTWSKTEAEAKSLAEGIKINTGSTIYAESGSEDNWSVSFEIRAPRNSNLDLKAHNGGISVRGVDGSITFLTQNGGVNLDGVAGTVKGRTTNGGVNVKLVGSSWKGSGLDVETTNGGVQLAVPANFAAHVETSTVNGGFTSDIVGLQLEKETSDNGYYRPRPKKVSTDINGGGPLVRAVTTNGGVRIKTLED